MQRPLEPLNHSDTVRSYRPQYEMVIDKIREYILAAHLRPGDRLPTEQSLARELGATRSVVREAIKYLTATGLVGARKGVGIYVAGPQPSGAQPHIHLSMPVDPEHIQALFAFRTLQEQVTVRLATEHITLVELRDLEQTLTRNVRAAQEGQMDVFLAQDDAFHLGIAQATKNPFLVETIASVLRLQRWAIHMITGGAPGSVLIAAQEHEEIFRAVRDGAPKQAEDAITNHIATAMLSYQQEVLRRLPVHG